jgi:hypothetical protein
MFIRNLTLTTVACSLLALIAVPTASASTALRTDPGGGLITGSTTAVNTSSGPSVMTLTGIGTVTCNAMTGSATVTRNSSATSISGTLSTVTFTSCTDSIPVIAITSCTLSPNSPLPSITVTATNDIGGTATVNDPTVRCNISGSATSFCYFTAATAAGVNNNAASTLTYTGVSVTVVAGSGSLGAVCGSTGTFSTTARHHVQVGTNRTVTVQTT